MADKDLLIGEAAQNFIADKNSKLADEKIQQFYSNVKKNFIASLKLLWKKAPIIEPYFVSFKSSWCKTQSGQWIFRYGVVFQCWGIKMQSIWILKGLQSSESNLTFLPSKGKAPASHKTRKISSLFPRPARISDRPRDIVTLHCSIHAQTFTNRPLRFKEEFLVFPWMLQA